MITPGTRVRVLAQDHTRFGHVATVRHVAPGALDAEWPSIYVEFDDSRPSAYRADELEVVA